MKCTSVSLRILRKRQRTVNLRSLQKKREREFFSAAIAFEALRRPELGWLPLALITFGRAVASFAHWWNLQYARKNQNGDRAAGKITQVGSILEEKQSLR